MRRLFLALALAVAPAPQATAQSPGGPLDPGVVRSPVLVIEFDTVYARSAYGQRVSRQLEAEGAEIAAENRRIEAELTEEERRLTEQRKSMAAEDFRELAAAFDEKVQTLRQQQDVKARSLNQRSEEAQRRFLDLARPVLERLMRESGAAVILERRAVFVAADVIDVTDDAIRLIDAAIGPGEALPAGTEAVGEGAASPP